MYNAYLHRFIINGREYGRPDYEERFADADPIRDERRVRLANYPPYHSKYNPIERVWGVLEQHWNGSLLDTAQTVLNFAKSITWRSVHPTVQRIHMAYNTGIRLTQDAMRILEQRFDRLHGLDKYFATVQPVPT